MSLIGRIKMLLRKSSEDEHHLRVELDATSARAETVQHRLDRMVEIEKTRLKALHLQAQVQTRARGK